MHFYSIRYILFLCIIPLAISCSKYKKVNEYREIVCGIDNSDARSDYVFLCDKEGNPTQSYVTCGDTVFVIEESRDFIRLKKSDPPVKWSRIKGMLYDGYLPSRYFAGDDKKSEFRYVNCDDGVRLYEEPSKDSRIFEVIRHRGTKVNIIEENIREENISGITGTWCYACWDGDEFLNNRFKKWYGCGWIFDGFLSKEKLPGKDVRESLLAGLWNMEGDVIYALNPAGRASDNWQDGDNGRWRYDRDTDVITLVFRYSINVPGGKTEKRKKVIEIHIIEFAGDKIIADVSENRSGPQRRTLTRIKG